MPAAGKVSVQAFNCADGGRLTYSVAGRGDPIVFLHGFGLDSSMWDPQWPVFCEHYRAIRYDLRGYGASSLPSSRYSHVDDFIALTDFLQARPTHLVGLSLGGRMALRIAVQEPAAVRSLTLVDPALDGHTWSSEWLKAWRAMTTTARTDVARAKRQWLGNELFARARGNAAVADALAAMVGRYSGWHLHSEDPDVGPSRPIIEALSTLSVPTLVIVGERDLPDFQVIARRIASAMPQASLTIIPDSGHMPNLEHPSQFNHRLLDHLRACSS